MGLLTREQWEQIRVAGGLAGAPLSPDSGRTGLPTVRGGLGHVASVASAAVSPGRVHALGRSLLQEGNV